MQLMSVAIGRPKGGVAAARSALMQNSALEFDTLSHPE
jgi:hypothetical protein